MNLSFQTQLLFVLLLGIIAQATGIDLANNTNFLLLLLLALGAYNNVNASSNCRNVCCGQQSYI